MAKCKNCDLNIEWGRHNDKWVPLIPIGEEGEHARTHIDERGELRTLHHVICNSKNGGVLITPLKMPVYVHAQEKRETVVNPPMHFHRVDALKEHCPTCNAMPGSTCTSWKGRERHALHRARYVITTKE